LEALIIKYLAGEASHEEARSLLDWISLSPENQSLYLGYKKIFDASTHQLKQSEPLIDIDINSEWRHFLNTVQPLREAPVLSLTGARPFWMKLAAALLRTVLGVARK